MATLFWIVVACLIIGLVVTLLVMALNNHRRQLKKAYAEINENRQTVSIRDANLKRLQYRLWSVFRRAVEEATKGLPSLKVVGHDLKEEGGYALRVMKGSYVIAGARTAGPDFVVVMYTGPLESADNRVNFSSPDNGLTVPLNPEESWEWVEKIRAALLEEIERLRTTA